MIAVETTLERVAETDAHEGPVYVEREHAVYFTTLPTAEPRVAIKRLDLASGDVSVVVEDANMANGMTLDRGGRLVICEQGGIEQRARISRLDLRTGAYESLVDAWGGAPLNSPNDVVVKSDGTIWFTDPSYGFLQGFRPEPRAGDYVYRYDPRTDALSVVADSFDKPNGLAFSPDESVLYVGDSGFVRGHGDVDVSRPRHVIAFDVVGGRGLANARLFSVTTPGFPDGIKVDAGGRVYVSAASGVQIFASDGDALGEIALPNAVNFTFGGSYLYVTTDDAVWAADLDAKEH